MDQGHQSKIRPKSHCFDTVHQLSHVKGKLELTYIDAQVSVELCSKTEVKEWASPCLPVTLLGQVTT